MTLEPTDGRMQVGFLQHTGASAGLHSFGPVSGPLIGDPRSDAIAQEQARFRVEGSGPISARAIVPVSDGARELLTASATGTTEAVRGILRLVEAAAGGPSASANVPLEGIAFSDSVLGHGANTYRAHMDSDPVFAASLRSLSPAQRASEVERLARDSQTEAAATKADTVAGWVNVGPDASGVLLAHQGLPLTQYSGSNESGLALAVRVLRHEAQHAADSSRPALPTAGIAGLREALAGSNSTTVDNLAAARTALGLDSAVGDAALAATIAVRPYPAYERVLDAALRAANIEPGSAGARQLVAGSSSSVAEALVSGIARAEGISTVRAQNDIGREFAAAHGEQA